MIIALPKKAAGMVRWLGLLILLPVIFAVFLVIQGISPFMTYQAMLKNVAGSMYNVGEVIIRAVPFLLTGLAAAIPARAGLINVGGEGQLTIGALTTTFAAVLIGDKFPGYVTIPLLVGSGMLGGAAWAGVTGLLKVRFRLNETISSLLLNYVAFFLMSYFIHGMLKDPASFNWPFSPPLAESAMLPVLEGTRVHLGSVFAVLAAVAVWYFVNKTSWGFRLEVIGGNTEAARRAGINVGKSLFAAMLIAGALGGLAGMFEVTGVEGRLRPATGVGFGYMGFLAAWTARHHPVWLIFSSLLLAVIVVSGDSLQIFAGLPASSINILTALVLLGVLALTGGRKQ